MDPHTILGIGKDASPDEIRRAYREKAGKFHPDKGGEAWVFQLVQDAYLELTTPSKQLAVAPNVSEQSLGRKKAGASVSRLMKPIQRQGKMVAAVCLLFAIGILAIAFTWDGDEAPIRSKGKRKTSQAVLISPKVPDLLDEAMENRTRVDGGVGDRDDQPSKPSVNTPKSNDKDTHRLSIPIVLPKLPPPRIQPREAFKVFEDLEGTIEKMKQETETSLAEIEKEARVETSEAPETEPADSVSFDDLQEFPIQKAVQVKSGVYSILTTTNLKLGRYKIRTTNLEKPDQSSSGEFEFKNNGEFIWNGKTKGEWEVSHGQLKLVFPTPRLQVKPAKLFANGFRGEAVDANGSPFTFEGIWLSEK